MSNLKSIPSYVWPGADFCYSEVVAALGSVATFWNPSASKGIFIHCSRNYLITKHKKDDKTWNIVNVYASNSR